MTGATQLPTITDAMQALPVRFATLDGEGVICGPDGKSDLDRMRACFGRNGAPAAFLYAFDLLQLDGRDLRNEPWTRRRAMLEQLLADAEAGIRLNEHIEDVDGAVVFRQACVMGLEGYSSPSGAIAATARDAVATGSRSRTRRMRQSSARC